MQLTLTARVDSLTLTTTFEEKDTNPIKKHEYVPVHNLLATSCNLLGVFFVTNIQSTSK